MKKTYTPDKPLTENQHKVLRYMDDKSIGCYFVDSLQRWIWAEDIRHDEKLANLVLAEKFDVRKP